MDERRSHAYLAIASGGSSSAASRTGRSVCWRHDLAARVRSSRSALIFSPEPGVHDVAVAAFWCDVDALSGVCPRRRLLRSSTSYPRAASRPSPPAGSRRRTSPMLVGLDPTRSQGRDQYPGGTPSAVRVRNSAESEKPIMRRPRAHAAQQLADPVLQAGEVGRPVEDVLVDEAHELAVVDGAVRAAELVDGREGVGDRRQRLAGPVPAEPELEAGGVGLPQEVRPVQAVHGASRAVRVGRSPRPGGGRCCRACRRWCPA